VEDGMRVLFANNFCGYVGGVEQVVRDTARGLSSRGHECFLAYCEEDRGANEYKSAFQKTWISSDFCGRDQQSSGRSLRDLCSEIQPDVIFVHKVSVLPRDARSLGIRLVRMVHDHDLYCPRRHKYFAYSNRVCHRSPGWRCWLDLAFVARRKGKRGYRIVNIRALFDEMQRNRDLDALLAVSNFVADALKASGFPQDRVHVVNPVLPLKSIEQSPLPNGNNVLFVGQLVRGKGLDLLLRALNQVRCDFTLTVIGSGHSEKRLRRLAERLGLGRSVTFEGWLPHSEVQLRYRQAYVVAVPSRWPEPFTLVGQEAMRHGRPVVAFDVGGNRDWLQDNETGYLVPEQDIGKFARALESLFGDRDMAQYLGDNGRRRVSNLLKYDDYISVIERHLKSPAQPRE
jgi:glycosyltransferase involved in cell wall biosynthesis